MVSALHLGIGDRKPQTFGLLIIRSGADIALEDARLQQITLRSGDVTAKQAQILRLLLLPGPLDFGQRDFFAVDLGREVPGLVGEVNDAVRAPGREHQREHAEHDEGQPTLTLKFVTNFLQHRTRG